MSFNRKRRAGTLFDEDEDVHYENMLKAISPPKKRLSLTGSKTPSRQNIFKSIPYPTPTSDLAVKKSLKESSASRASVKHEPGLPSGSDFKDRPTLESSVDGLESAVAKAYGGASEKRTCSRASCRNELPAYTRFKSCDRCRQRSRDQQRKKRVAKDAKIRAVLYKHRHSSPFKYEEELEMPKDWSHLSQEERFRNYLSQLRSAGMLKTGKSYALEANSSEYQTAEDLYVDLARALVSAEPGRHTYKSKLPVARPADFRGYYQAVRDAASPVTRERVFEEVRVAEDKTLLQLRKDVVPTVGKFAIENNVGYVVEYQCGCRSDRLPCGGTVTVKIAKVQAGILHGEKVTYRVKHA